MKCSEARTERLTRSGKRRPYLPALPETASRILYAEIPRQEIALYRFLLEGYDNLAIMSVVDRYRAVIRLRFLSAAEKTLRALVLAQGGKLIEPPFVLPDTNRK